MPFEKLLPLGHCLMGPTYKVCSLKEIAVLKKVCSGITQKHEVNAQNLELVPVLGQRGGDKFPKKDPKHTKIVFGRIVGQASDPRSV